MEFLVYDKTDEATEGEVARMSSYLSQQRVSYAQSYKKIQSQWLCLKSFDCLTLLLPNINLPHIEWLVNPYGKPYIKKGKCFSISHCSSGIAVATHNKSIGIDIENLSRWGHSTNWFESHKLLIFKTMCDREISLIRASSTPSFAFLALWTQKEAYYKCIGTGIGSGIKDCLSCFYRGDTILEKRTFKFAQKNYVISIVYEP